MPTRSAARGGPPHNLPEQPTPLIGRARERATAQQQLLLDEVRLLTLCGPGGVGKTRLALAVAADLLGARSSGSAQLFPDGVWFVDLAPLRDSSLVLPAVAQVVDVRELGDRPIVESLDQHLRERRLLLVLDNFEQVLPAGAAVAELLSACPGLKVLVTSREPLRLRWERTFAVPLLPLPDLRHQLPPEALAHVPSVALFVERSRAVAAGFQLTAADAPAVARICVRLDGLPLAIELAAARSSTLTPPDMLARLERALPLLRWDAQDLPARHRTLRAAIGWSHGLLTPDEQALFRRLGVFVGGCTLEAAEAVCVGGERGETRDESEEPHPLSSLVSPLPTLDGLSALADKGLVQVTHQSGGGSRFRLLETIHEYALEQLRASGEIEATRRGHAAYFLGVAEEAEPALRGPDQVAWLDRLEAEHDNLRAALAWSDGEASDPERMARLAAALYRFWWRRGYLSEGREWTARALGRDDLPRGRARAKGLNGAAVLAREQADYGTAQSLFEESLAIFRELEDRWGIANALQNLASVAIVRGDHDRAAALLQESLALWREPADTWGRAIALGLLGRLAQRQGDYGRATALHEQSLSLFREAGEIWGLARFLNSLGHLAYEQGDLERATRLGRESLPLFRRLRDRRGIANGRPRRRPADRASTARPRLTRWCAARRPDGDSG
jgi:predicted ATPase